MGLEMGAKITSKVVMRTAVKRNRDDIIDELLYSGSGGILHNPLYGQIGPVSLLGAAYMMRDACVTYTSVSMQRLLISVIESGDLAGPPILGGTVTTSNHIMTRISDA